MSKQITLDKLKEHLLFFRKMYDIVRIVDPLKKQVLEYSESIIGETDKVCHDYWKDGVICDNCISTRAYRENRTYMKLEQSPDLIMMVTAIPIGNTDNPIVLELLKNATDTMLIGTTGEYSNGEIIQNVVTEMNDMIIRDTLTSLYNRRFLNERLPADIIKSTIEGWPISVVLMDIDNLKEINDTYGHIVGDQALKEVANVLENTIDLDSSWVARYGGDEFLICFNNVLFKDVYKIAEQVRINIEEVQLIAQDEEIPVTVSLGIHTAQETMITADELINSADRKMYQAKTSGRNCIAY